MYSVDNASHPTAKMEGKKKRNQLIRFLGLVTFICFLGCAVRCGAVRGGRGLEKPYPARDSGPGRGRGISAGVWGLSRVSLGVY